MTFYQEIEKTVDGKTYRYRIYGDPGTREFRIWSCNAGDFIFTSHRFSKFITALDHLQKWLSGWSKKKKTSGCHRW